MGTSSLLRATDLGLYCEAGDFYIDPWRPVPRAVLTHGHADHACPGCGRYLAASDGEAVLRQRLGASITIDPIPYREPLFINGVRVSLHPAGHILGSAQVRLEAGGMVAVVSGDYKIEPDATCAPFEPVECDLFVTESTFGLPIYRWRPQQEIHDDINAWWRANQEAGKTSLLFAYALGKSQRLLSGLDPSIGPIRTHGAVEAMTRAYRASGVALPETIPASAPKPEGGWHRAIVLAPPSAQGTPWTRKFGAVSGGFASGWMRIRGARRRRAVDRGFVLSDHVDWPGLLTALDATKAREVLVTHGYSSVVVRHLRDRGIDADVLATRYEGEAGAVATGEDQDTGDD